MVPKPTATSRLLYMIYPANVDEESLAVAKQFAVHVEITDVKPDGACGHRAIALHLNRRGVPLVDRFTTEGNKKYDSFWRQKTALQLQEREWIANMKMFSDRIFAGVVREYLIAFNHFNVIYFLVIVQQTYRRQVCIVLLRCPEETVCSHRK